ncbi:MAG: signal peptide peptidase SppA, type [Fibrobacteres bacterium]|nr:signal peptide peptidase SppA, type [Fibrobacterota bacterium]
MKTIFKPILALIPLAVQAWESPLPFSNGVATNTSQGAFANPAGSGFGTENRFGASWSEWNTVAGGNERLWALRTEGTGHAEGFRFWEGDAPYLARFDAARAWNVAGFLTPGIRPAYVWDGKGPDHLLVDGGLDARPIPQLMAGYWGENLWSGGDEPITQHFALALRPWANHGGALSDFNLGVGLAKPDSGKRRTFMFTRIPLGFGFLLESEWDPKNRSGSLGLTLQATGQWAGALGSGRGASFGMPGMEGRLGRTAAKGRRRQAGLEFRTDQKTPFLLSAGNVAELDLNRTMVEGVEARGFLASGGELGFLELGKRFDVIEANPRVKAVLVKLGNAHCGWAMGEEIRGRLLRLRGRGIRVVAYLDQVTPLNYFLASAADVVAMQPQGYFAVNGFSAEVMFYRGLFDKLGVEPQFLRHGKFKSFEEPYTRKEMSDPMRADLAGFLGSMWEHFLGTIAASRGLPIDSVRRSLESGEISLEHARKARLIDTLIYQDQALELAGGKGATLDHSSPRGNAQVKWDIPPEVALVVVTGNMVLGSSARSWLAGPDLAGSETVAAQLRRARKTPSVKAVVLRVDSPGGSAQAADIMWREVELLKKAGKPVVASVGADAASGGYYLICGADRIIAAPNSVVGSIGVLWGKFVLKGLYEKLGLNTQTVKTSPHADANSMARTWDSSEVEVLQRHMDQFYDDFISKVAAGRGKTKAGVDSLGQGRIYTGRQALANGLVDRLGGMQDAIEEAAKLAGLGSARNVEVVPYSAQGEPSVLSLAGRDWAHAAAPVWTEALRGELARIESLSGPGLWAISPELAGWPGTAGPVGD